MALPGQPAHQVRFGEFELDLQTAELCNNGDKFTLQDQPFQVLTVLLEHPGRLVTREELKKKLWPSSTFVDFDHGLNKAVNRLREALDDSADNPRFIETLPRKGYRFIGPLELIESVVRDETSSPPATALKSNLIGKKVSHYRVLELLGGGGMGLVFQAEDLKLGRRVALKFLPEELASDTVARERFEREARAASALNHPNICTVHAIEEHEGQPFLAMEFLEGETLRELIAASQASSRTAVEGTAALPLPKLLDVAVQVTAGLEAAHRKGIIHRDIKPANIFVTTQGQAKILDFGLAKLQGSDALEPQLAPLGGEQLKQKWNPNLTLTRTGATIGTAGYMSPEQVRGDKLDARSDLFSFGMVLYEMATGQRAFQGDTAPVLRDAILRTTPTPVRELDRKIPPRLESIINKALEKDREARYQSASEIHADLKESFRETQPGRVVARAWVLAVGISAVLAIVGVVFWLTKRQPSSPLDLKQRQLTANSSENAVVSGTISPDGRFLAYSDRQGIHIKRIETGEVQTVPQPPELKGFEVNWALAPTWPRESTTLIANVNIPGQQPSIWSVPIVGGPPRKLRDGAFAYTLSRDGSRLAFTPTPDRYGVGNREMWVMRSDGSDAKKLYQTDENSAFIGAEWWPDGRRLAYNMYREVAGKGEILIETRDLEGGPSVTVVRGGTSDWSWSPDGRLIHGLFDPDPVGTSCNLWATPIDLRSGRPKQEAKRLTNWAGFCVDSLSETADGKRLAFRKWSWQGSVYVADIQDGGTRMSTPRRLTLNEGRNYPGAWTADSKAVVFGSYVDGQWSVFKQSLEEETSEPITTREQGDIVDARVSPDGAWILYVTQPVDGGNSSRLRQLMRAPIKRGPPELVLTARLYGDPHCARAPATLCVIAERTEDNKQLVFTAFDPLRGRGRELTKLDTEPTDELDYVWDLSPDGTRIAVLKYSAEKIRVFPLEGSSPKEIIAKGWNSLQSVSWAADGKGFFVSGTANGGSALLKVDLVGNVHVLWEQKGSIAPWNVPLAHRWGPSAPWAVPSPDGRHLAVYVWSHSANIWMMENF